MRRRSKAKSKLVKAQRRKAEMARHRAAPRLARERGEYPRRDELRPTLDTALDAVVVMKSDGVVADWNDRAVVVLDGRACRAQNEKAASVYTVTGNRLFRPFRTRLQAVVSPADDRLPCRLSRNPWPSLPS